ncbi:MAG TPA: biotin/lipoyl-containing protein [Pyrinomonadaceae bacterium]|jgi:biotin carboxyl carrier protein
MRLTAEIEGHKHELQLTREGSRVTAEIDGRRYEVEMRASQPGTYLLLSGGRVYDCRVDRPEVGRGAVEVSIGGRSYALTLTDPKRLRGGSGAGAQADGSAQIIAPMPGKVVRVLVELGAEVQAGDGIVVVEAMKMQNEMKSPKTGKVTALRAIPGTTVNAGDVLAIIE